MAESFTLIIDENNIPVCAYQVGADALNQIPWGALQIVDETKITDASGYFQADNKPILDINGDRTITSADVNPRRVDNSVSLYVGTSEGEVDSNKGRFRLFTDAELTVPAVNLNVKCTYWTVKPIKIDVDGYLQVKSADDVPQGDVVGADESMTWDNSDPVDTSHTLTITKPEKILSTYELIIYNPSEVTDLTVKVLAEETALGGATRSGLITTFYIPKAQSIFGSVVDTHVRLLQGIFNGADCRLVVSNDVVLGSTDGFTAHIRMREVR